MLENIFKLKEHGTNVRTEIMAGITTFMTMAYIIAVNPLILSDAGMPAGPVMVATCLAAALGTFLMGFLANYPFALAPGMGLNAFFAYTVVLTMGLSWQAALAAVFISGIIFLLLTLTKVREAIVNSIPLSLKYSVSVGIGLFIALIGLKNAGIIVHNPATGTLGLVTPHYFADEALLSLLPFGTSPQSIMLALFGLVITGALVVKKVRGSLLWGILATTIIGIPLGVVQLGQKFSPVSMPPSISETLFAMDFAAVFSYGLIPIIFAFTFVDLFDTIGTLVGVSSKAGMLDKNGHLPKANKALLADSIATMAGAALGTSTTTTYIESAAGVAEGGRTGLTAVTTGVLFLLALFFSPLVGIIPSAATAPILVIVGIFMMEPVTKIDFSDYLEAIPAFFAMFMMPLAFSIAEGIVFGVISYTVLRALTGRAKEISLTMWILTALFIVRFFVG
ncbi:MAG: guanine permease [Clostridiaceae bacterium BRH_c20a]|nr:MAG: guanine permease [Clostridiaceae bacterium BRH_c20a]